MVPKFPFLGEEKCLVQSQLGPRLDQTAKASRPSPMVETWPQRALCPSYWGVYQEKGALS